MGGRWCPVASLSMRSWRVGTPEPSRKPFTSVLTSVATSILSSPLPVASDESGAAASMPRSLHTNRRVINT